MEVSAHYLGATKFEVAARGHRVICDQPIDTLLGQPSIGITVNAGALAQAQLESPLQSEAVLTIGTGSGSRSRTTTHEGRRERV